MSTKTATDSNIFIEQSGADDPSMYTAPTEPISATEPSEIIAPTEPVEPSTDTDPTRRTPKQRRSDLDDYRRRFMQTPRIEDRKPVFISRETRDRLDRIVRLLGERGMSVSGFIENLARHHLAAHETDIECWRKL